ncbi:MAG: hypothetical protein KGZ87_05565 [Bacteroidetes bacterium]|nr:hypothetical protein [Bacteroidota bacterium]
MKKNSITVAIIGMSSPMIAAIWLLVNEGVSHAIALLVTLSIYLAAFVFGYYVRKALKNIFNR